MTTDITELAQSLKAAAEKASQGNWRAFKYHDGSCGIGGGHHDEIMVCEHISKRRPHDAEFIALANPANILALVEALEKAQQQMTESENRVRKQNRHICELFDDNTALRQRIAGLEARTVTVKQGEVLVTVAGFTGCGKSAIAGEIEIAMKAIGLPVTWANGDSEKRMTGADWLTAIEMYKPTVRIVEVNIPRAAGIKVEAE
ncbi:TPA: ead/Ea22-like family protein [Klebsiella pneumoniae]|uniref:ead/Ea22-like family protein n=1 Tax=Klebsiella pneumoniae TaxID=573 RepID=UPI00237FC54B|nr:ead/Ea22-like family protein [Klebsiella pneumoniae]HCJ1383567.1 ead/Ea22-like family protein [Klebsiella pneumoniae]HCJ1758172.1 ead/Ea22-like family protein [Klebsiella pneumoniae]HCJ3437245.1 ead/Ea22-like family protein [Klebsiella pneumoniae]HCJ3912385.1 ead/Ea22-like family protein [Klebsiella pneumoniae]HCK0230100.1 ead/Ea22-like family protein [Klebsiella pneumoniae]